MLVVLASLAIGGIIGSLLRLEARVEGLGGWLQTRLAGDAGSVERHRFIEGFVVSSLVFCTGPLTILGSLNDGLGLGADQLYPEGHPGRVRRDRVRRVVRLGRGGQRADGAGGPGRADRCGRCSSATCCPTPTSPSSPPSVVCSSSGSPCGCSGSREIPVADLLPALVVAPLLLALVAAFR